MNNKNLTLTEVAKKLQKSDKKVQLIYAFNGTGKTRLSKEFKNLIDSKDENEEFEEFEENKKDKVLYYNAYTEDLFYWDNDLDNSGEEKKLKIHPNSFTDWLLKEQGEDQNIITCFQNYISNNSNVINKLTPKFNKDFSEVTFSLQKGNDTPLENLKISKGEESNFIWCIFYIYLEILIENLNEDIENRDTDRFDELEYIFIDDPISSLDENHLIELAINLATLIKNNKSEKLKFIISTHNTFFYNILHNCFKNPKCYLYSKNEDNTFNLEEKKGDSNTSFSYHMHLLNILKKAINDDKLEKFHFNLLRNLYEKIASFLGYTSWKKLLPDTDTETYERIINNYSHSTLSYDQIAEPTSYEKGKIDLLLKHLIEDKDNKIKFNITLNKDDKNKKS